MANILVLTLASSLFITLPLETLNYRMCHVKRGGANPGKKSLLSVPFHHVEKNDAAPTAPAIRPCNINYSFVRMKNITRTVVKMCTVQVKVKKIKLVHFEKKKKYFLYTYTETFYSPTVLTSITSNLLFFCKSFSHVDLCFFYS
jgi:hypothetical protein